MDRDRDCTVIFSKTPVLDGCFADSNTGKNLTNYQGNLTIGVGGIYGLLRRVNDPNLGYMLTDPARVDQTKSFRTKLAGNINKYITSRYCPNTALTDVWSADTDKTATIKKLF